STVPSSVSVFQRGTSGYVDVCLSILFRIFDFLCRYFRLPTPEDPELDIFGVVRRIPMLWRSFHHGFPVCRPRRSGHGALCNRNSSLRPGLVRRWGCKAAGGHRPVGGTPANLRSCNANWADRWRNGDPACGPARLAAVPPSPTLSAPVGSHGGVGEGGRISLWSCNRQRSADLHAENVHVSRLGVSG